MPSPSKSATAAMSIARVPAMWLAMSASSADLCKPPSRQLHNSSDPITCGWRTSAMAVLPSPLKSAMPAGSSQRCGCAKRRRLGDDFVFALAQANHRQRRAALEIGFHHDDLIVAVAIEIGEPRFEIFEHSVVFKPHGLAFAVAGFDH